MSGKIKETRIIEAAENSDKIRISSDPLYCPICFTVFGSAPVVLHCGHTFCVKCVRTLIQRAIYECPPMRTPEYECALCRSKVSANDKLCRNFIIEDILGTIDVATDENPTENEIIKAQGLLLKRSKEQLRESDEKLSILTSQLLIIQKRLYYAIGAVSGLTALLIAKMFI
uniref:RING-type domain-containing protein n=1 Tax=Panagrolaimus davidi TaxID=227884 RepID=A0A914Q8T9_9BILA